MTGSSDSAAEQWFADDADAKKYIGEVGKVWLVWLLGLAALAFSRGIVAVVAGVALLVALFILMTPLQNRVQQRYGNDLEGRTVPKRETLSSRDKALRELTYGRAPFAAAVEMRGMWIGLKLVPWVIIAATLVAAAIVATQWFEG